MTRRLLRALLFVGLTGMLVLMWNLWGTDTLSLFAQGENDPNDQVCRNLFPDDYANSSQNVDIMCVNSLDDVPDFDVSDGVCDSDEATAGLQCTLRAAVMEANAPPASVEDLVIVPAGSYSLTIPIIDRNDEEAPQIGDLDILSSVHIKGAGKEQVIIDANGVDRAFQILYTTQEPTQVKISGVTITGGEINKLKSEKRNGGGIYNNGDLTLEDVIVKNYNDAGIYNVQFSSEFLGKLTLIDSVVQGGGEATKSRTGIWVGGGIVTLLRSMVTNNYSDRNKHDGAGINIEGSPVRFSTVVLTNSTISGNTAWGSRGGGIFIKEKNNAGTYLKLEQSTIKDNLAQDGGGLYAEYGWVVIEGSTFSGNIAQDKNNSNGGPDNRGESTSGRGGAIYHGSEIPMFMDNSTLSGNGANAHGGGVFVDGHPNKVTKVSVITITNSTITLNQADRDGIGHGDGGGIFLFPQFTVKGNIAYLSPQLSGKAYLQNTILANNDDLTLSDLRKHRDCSQWNITRSIFATDTVKSRGNNLIGVNFGCEANFPVGSIEYPLSATPLNPYREYINRERFQPRSIYTEWNDPFPAGPTFPNDDPGTEGFEGSPYPDALCPDESVILINPNFNLSKTGNDWVGTRKEQDDCANVSGPIDPRLLPLRDNGSGVETHALLTSDEPSSVTLEKRSFAIDSGDCVGGNIDQRGAFRNQDGDNNGIVACDIGAYEVVPNDVSIFVSADVEEVASTQKFQYSIEYFNQGSLEATSVSISHNVPPHLKNVNIAFETDDGVVLTQRANTNYVWDLTNLKPGDSGKIIISGVIDPELTEIVVMNLAAVIQSADDPNNDDGRDDNAPINNTSKIDVVAKPGVDLSIGLSASKVVPLNKVFAYQIVVTNSGPATANGFFVTHALPTNTSFNAAGTSENCTYDKKSKIITCKGNLLGANTTTAFIVAIKPTKSQTITLEARTNSSFPDPNPDDNSVTVDVAVKPDVDLSVTASALPESPTTDDTITYEIVVGNAGPQTASNIVLEASWSKDFATLQTVNDGSFNCVTDEVERTIACTLGSLKKNNKRSIKVVVLPSVAGTLEMQASVKTNGSADDVSDNNFVSLETTITQGDGPTATPTSTPTATSQTGNTPTATATLKPGQTPNPTATLKPGETPAPTSTPTSTATTIPEESPTPSPTPTNTATVVAGSEPILDVRPAFLLFRSAGGTNPIESQKLTIENDGKGTLNWTATASEDWIALYETSGTATAGDSAELEVSISSRGLKQNLYQGEITISSDTNGVKDSPQTVRVNLVLSGDAADKVTKVETVNQQGGKVRFPGRDGWVILDFEDGTFERKTDITLEIGGEINHPAGNGLSFLTDRFFSVTALDPQNGPVSKFNKPYKITVTYLFNNFKDVTNDKSTIDLYYWDETSNQWTKAYDSNCAQCERMHIEDENTITVTLNHMTDFALMSESDAQKIYLPLVIK